MLRAVVPLVRGERLSGCVRGVIGELIALALRHAIGSGGRFTGRRSRLMPGFAAIVRALDDLSEPAAGLRRIDSVWVSGRPFQVINLPAGKVRAAHVPLFTLAIGTQYECALTSSNQYAYLAHACSFSKIRRCTSEPAPT